MKNAPKVIENDAIVVICLRDMADRMTHHEFRVRAATRGFTLSKSACHNMLHRALGRVRQSSHGDRRWYLTAMGAAYRDEVLNTIHKLASMEVGTRIFEPDA